MIAKIPIVIPSNDKNVRNLFALSELKANEKLSNINLIRSIGVIQFASKVKISFFILLQNFGFKNLGNYTTSLNFFAIQDLVIEKSNR